jgi:hypothetical protein
MTVANSVPLAGDPFNFEALGLSLPNQ